jgi:hypothetical protein
LVPQVLRGFPQVFAVAPAVRRSTIMLAKKFDTRWLMMFGLASNRW